MKALAEFVRQYNPLTLLPNHDETREIAVWFGKIFCDNSTVEPSVKRVLLFIGTLTLCAVVLMLATAEMEGKSTHGTLEVCAGILAGVITGSYLGGKKIEQGKQQTAPGAD